MKRLGFILLLVALALTGRAQFVDYSRNGVNNGAGIDYHTNAVYMSDYLADNTGVADSWGAWTNAYAHCPNGGAIVFSNGVFKLSDWIGVSTSNRHITIRGMGTAGTNGPNRTLLRSTYSGGSPKGGISFYAADTSRQTPTIVSGYTAGSTSVVVSSSSGLASNQICRIFLATNDANFVFGSLTDPTKPSFGEMNRIVGISGVNVYLEKPIAMDGNALCQPTLWAFTKAPSRCYVDSLILEMTDPTPENGYWSYITDQCGATNFVITNAYFAAFNVQQSYAWGGAYLENQGHQAYDSNTRYGIQFTEFASRCLLIDSIMQGNNLAFTFQQGATANAIVGLYASRGFGSGYPLDSSLKGYGAGHGDFSRCNYVGRSKFPAWTQDEFWGCNYSNILHGSWVTRTSEYDLSGTNFSPQGATAMFIDASNYNMRVTATIVGSPRDKGAGPADEWVVGFARRQTNFFLSGPYDMQSTNTLFTDGNYSFGTNGTFHRSGTPVVYPVDYVYSNRPPWWGGVILWTNTVWTEASVSAITNEPFNPAEARWRRISYQSVGTSAVAISAPGLPRAKGFGY